MRLKNIVQKKDFKILVVDDEQGVIDSLNIFLRDYVIRRNNRSPRSYRAC